MMIALVLMIVPLILFVFVKSGQKVTALPGDPVGKSSLALAIVSLLFLIPAAVMTHPETDSGPVLNPVLAAALTAIPAAAMVTGAISMIRSRERCVLVFLSTAAGLALLLGAIGYFFI
jgi:hypothetical protein